MAEAMGLRVYAARGLRMKQLEAVRAVMSGSDFPKAKGGFLVRAEVAAFALANIEIHKDGRKFKLNPQITPMAADKATVGETLNIEHRTLNPELPGGGEPQDAAMAKLIVSLAEREAILSKLPPDYRRRYEGLYSKWMNPNSQSDKALTKSEYDELVAVGLVKRGAALVLGSVTGSAAPMSIPDYCNHSEFAELMTKLYNVHVYPMRISRAVNEQGMAGKMSNQSIKTSLAIPWWEENVVRKEAPGQGSLFQQAAAAKLQEDIDRARITKLEMEELERSTSEKWMQRSVVENFIEGFGAWLGERQNKFIEDKAGLRRQVAEAGSAIGLTLEQVQKLDAKLSHTFPLANDSFKADCASRAAELLKQLDDYRKEQIDDRR